MLSGLTYNVFLGQTFEALLTWLLDDNEPLDFYCLQEFPEHKLAELKDRLGSKGYDLCFAPGFTWRGITYGEVTIFKTAKLELVETKTLSLGGKGEPNLVFIRSGLKFDVRIAKIQIDKSALITTFKHGRTQFSLVNTHLCSDIHNTRKLRQLLLILEALQSEGHTIILGDFNYAVGRELSRLMAKHGYTGAVKKQKTFRFAPGIYWQNDYIFHQGCDIKDVAVHRVPHSDHYPIFFNVSL